MDGGDLEPMYVVMLKVGGGSALHRNGIWKVATSISLGSEVIDLILHTVLKLRMVFGIFKSTSESIFENHRILSTVQALQGYHE